MHTVLVVGGYGFFGKRICASLATHPLVRVLVCGRHHDQAIALTQKLKLPAEHAVEIDVNSVDFASTLSKLSVDTLIHTAGPFQQQDYAVARAAITAGCNYIDLADGREFVVGIRALDSLARERDVTIISGASSVPALSSAVVNKCSESFQRVDAILMGIGSGARAPGIATVKGIFGYCGKSFSRKENDAWVKTYGWLDLQRHHFPEPVGSRWLGSCDVPDLDLFAEYYPSVKTITFHAGFASDVGHLVIWFLAGCVKLGLLPSLRPLAPMFCKLSRWIEPLVSDKGAMFVTLEGQAHDGTFLRKTWNIVASQNHGPHIPCSASIALVNKLASGSVLPKGAMACIGLLTIEEYLAPLEGLDIREVWE